MMNCHGDDRKQEANIKTTETETEKTKTLIYTSQPALSTKFTTAMSQIPFHQM